MVKEKNIGYIEAINGGVLEIEFPDIEQAKSYPSPEWVSKDVTEDLRYKNSSLARFGIPEVAI